MNYEHIIQYDDNILFDYYDPTQALRGMKIDSSACIKYFLGYNSEILFDIIKYSKYGNVGSPYIELTQITSFRVNSDYRVCFNNCVDLKSCIKTINSVLWGKIFTEKSLIQVMDIFVDWVFGDNKYNLTFSNDAEYNITKINKIIAMNQRKEQIETDFKVIA